MRKHVGALRRAMLRNRGRGDTATRRRGEARPRVPTWGAETDTVKTSNAEQDLRRAVSISRRGCQRCDGQRLIKLAANRNGIGFYRRYVQ